MTEELSDTVFRNMVRQILDNYCGIFAVAPECHRLGLRRSRCWRWRWLLGTGLFTAGIAVYSSVILALTLLGLRCIIGRRLLLLLQRGRSFLFSPCGDGLHGFPGLQYSLLEFIRVLVVFTVRDVDLHDLLRPI